MRINGWPARITHFTVMGRLAKYRGLGLVASVPNGTFGFACVFRDEDSGEATSVCDDILNSAKIVVPDQYKPYVAPADPPEDPPDDPPDCDCAKDDDPD